MLSSSVFCVCSERHWCVVTIRATDLSREAQTQMPCARHTKKSQKEKKFSNEISTIELTVPLNSTLSLIDLFLDLHFSGKTIIHPPFLAEIDNCQRNIHTKKKRRTQDKKKERHRRHVFLCLTRGEMSLSATYVCWTLRFPTFSLTSIVTYCTHRSHTEQKHTLIRVIYVSLSVSRLKPREPNTQNTINVKPQNDLYVNHIGLFIFIILLLARKEERKNEKRNRLLYVQLKCMC